ncbi:MAG: ABC transporter permease, partial [Oscillospiraceae bacterium]
MSTLKFILKRMLLGILVLLGTSVMIFIIARVVPGDVATIALGSRATDAAKEALREELYLNDPLPIQYVKWLGDVVQGDFGNSFITKRPVSMDVKQFFPATAELAIFAGIFMTLGTFGLGILSGKHKNTWIDGFVRIMSYVGIALPAFVEGVLLLILFV